MAMKPVEIDPAIEALLYDDRPDYGDPILNAMVAKWHHEDRMREIREFDVESFVMEDHEPALTWDDVMELLGEDG